MPNGYEYRFGSDQSILGLYYDLLFLVSQSHRDYESATSDESIDYIQKKITEDTKLIEEVRTLRRKILDHLGWEDKGE